MNNLISNWQIDFSWTILSNMLGELQKRLQLNQSTPEKKFVYQKPGIKEINWVIKEQNILKIEELRHLLFRSSTSEIWTKSGLTSVKGSNI